MVVSRSDMDRRPGGQSQRLYLGQPRPRNSRPVGSRVLHQLTFVFETGFDISVALVRSGLCVIFDMMAVLNYRHL